jgi:hypothetical protein
MKTVKATGLLFALSLGLCAIEPAFAIWFRSYSIEWQTDAADVVVVVEVRSGRQIEPLNAHWDSQEVSCRVLETIKGEFGEDVSFRQDFANRSHPVKFEDRPLKAGDHVLLFVNKTAGKKGHEVENWVNLTSPNQRKVTGSHAACDNDCTLLQTREAILGLIKARVESGSVLKRGLIVRFKPGGDYRHDFVITAEPEYKGRILELLAIEDWYARCLGIFNLVSYPGKETERLLRGFLDDDKVAFAGFGEQETEYHPVRHAAFIALRLLDVDVPAPKKFREDLLFSYFEQGFDCEDWFPKGNWRRLRDIAEPPLDPPFDFLRGQKPVHEDHDWRKFDFTFSFEGDPTKVREVVDKELLSKGFVRGKEDPSGFGKAWRPVNYRRGDEIVAMYKNMKFPIPDPEASRRGPARIVRGWVSFHVKLERRIRGTADREETPPEVDPPFFAQLVGSPRDESEGGSEGEDAFDRLRRRELFVTVRIRNMTSQPMTLMKRPSEVRMSWRGGLSSTRPGGSGFGSRKEDYVTVPPKGSVQFEVRVLERFLDAAPSKRTLKIVYRNDGHDVGLEAWTGFVNVQVGPDWKGRRETRPVELKWPNGNLRETGRTVNGRKTGAWHYFNEQGDRIKIIEYDSGNVCKITGCNPNHPSNKGAGKRPKEKE